MSVEFTFEFQKAKAALLFLADQNVPELTKGKVCKLFFLADQHHLVRHARPITGDRYAAIEHGPVPSRMLDLLDSVEAESGTTREAIELAKAIVLDRSFRYPHIQRNEPPHLENLSTSDIESLSEVIREFGGKSFTELRRLTHEMPAYLEAWETRTCGSSPMRFETFFEEEESALAGVKEEMIENSKLRAIFPEPAWL